ncbi:hypothetical protein [Actinospica robiniae]|uniref:hypothetical protein n=1 Tax=Actinospica robiniae TaxID=304901 RepID=UPI000422817C|nr:hypothetical protein [Actinospica robiniae]
MGVPLNRFAAAWRRPGCAALALLAGCVMSATAVSARVDLQSRTNALQAAVNQTPVTLRTVEADADYPLFAAANSDPGTAIDQETGRFYATMAPHVPVQGMTQAWADLVSPPVGLSDAPASAIASPGTPPMLTVDYRQNLSAHAKLVAGHWPDTTQLMPDGSQELEIAVTPATLARLSAHVGSSLVVGGSPMIVVGVVTPTDPDGAFWRSRPYLGAPVLDTPGLTPPYWDTGAFIGTNEIAILGNVYETGELELSWTVPLVETGYQPGETAAIVSALTSGLDGDALELYRASASGSNTGNNLGIGLELKSGLAPTLERFVEGQNDEAVEIALPMASLVVIGLIALALLTRTSLDRRASESRLLLARGAPLRELLGRAAADSILTMLPMFAVASGITLALPGTAPSALWWHLGLIGVAATAAPTVLTFGRYWPALHRHVRAEKTGSGLRRRSRVFAVDRGLVLRTAAAVLCVAGLDQVHASGLASGGGVDFYTACAPLLAATLATLVTLALGPAVLRVLMRRSRRGRGAILLLGLGRIARTPAPAAIIVFILTLALSTADIAFALHRTTGAVAQSADQKPLAHAIAMYLTVLSAAALGAGCVIVAISAFGDAAERRATTARLTVTGMTAGQARGVTAVELGAPIVFAVLGGTIAAYVLPWIVRPALAAVLGRAGVRLTVADLAVPVSTLIPLALLAGLGGAALARRGAAAVLRLGDQAQGEQ